MTERDFLHSQAALVWVSCFDKPRSADEIAKAWDYTHTSAFSQTKVFSEMLGKNLLVVAKIENKQNYYSSKLEGYFELVKDEENPDLEALVKDQEVWLEILNSPEIRESFLSLEAIQKLFRNKNFEMAKFYGFVVPISSTVSALTSFGVLKAYGLTIQQLVKSPLFAGAFSMGNTDLDLGSFLEFSIKKKIKAEVLMRLCEKAANTRAGILQRERYAPFMAMFKQLKR